MESSEMDNAVAKTKFREPGKRHSKGNEHPLPLDYWFLSLALLLAVISYWPTLRYGFVFDDVQQIIENPAIKSWNVSQYFTAHVGAGAFPGVKGNFYRPLFLLWLRLNHILFNLAPWGWHLTNLLAHLAAIWIFFLLVRRWTSDGVVAGWATLIFAVHPIHIEAVAWVSAVPEIQFTLAGLGAIYCFVRYRLDQRRGFLYGAVILYGIALLAKETAVVIWPMIAACSWWLDRESGSQAPSGARLAAVKLQLPFALVTAAYVALRLYALRGIVGDPSHTTADVLSSAPSLAWFYVTKLLAPFGLSQIYFDPDTGSFASPRFYVPLIAVCGVGVGLLLWGRKSKAAAFAGLLLALSLVPPLLGVSVFPRHDLAHNRYAYLPSAGACMLFALALRSATRGGRPSTSAKKLFFASLFVAAIALGLVFSVRAQEEPFRDNIALFTRAVQLSPESAMAWGLLGEEYMTLGRYTEGIDAFRHAQQLEPDVLLNNYRLGAAYYLTQDMPSAEIFFQRAVDSYRERDVVTHDYALYRLGLSQYAQSKMAQAEDTLRQATELQPKGFGYHVALGAVLKYQGKLPEAKQQLELELKLGPDAEASKILDHVDAELARKGIQYSATK